MTNAVSIPRLLIAQAFTTDPDATTPPCRRRPAVPIWSVTAKFQEISMKIVALVAALSLAVGGGVGSANAVGCLSGAVVGGVAGHLAHHHALLGAAAGCAIGHHMAVVAKRKKQAAAQAQAQAAHTAPAHP
jgi:hypothetical protein